MGLQLPDQIEVGRYDRADHEVAAARNRVAMQHDRFRAARHLDGAVGIASVDDVGGVRPSAEGRFARNEFKRSSAAEAIADAIGFRRDFPVVLEEMLAGGLGDAMPIEAGHHAQLGGRAGRATQSWRDGAPLRRASARAERKFVAGRQFAPLMAAERAERVGRPRPENHGHVDAAGNGDIGARARLQKIERERLTFLHREGGPRRARRAVDFGRQFRAGYGDRRVRGELQLGPEKGRLENGRVLRIADEQVGGAQRQAIHAAGDGNADVVIAGPAEILHGGGQTGLDDFNGHGAPPSAWRWFRRCPCESRRGRTSRSPCAERISRRRRRRRSDHIRRARSAAI